MSATNTQGEDAGAGLLPCPHCGGAAKCLRHHYGSNAEHWRAFCDQTTFCSTGTSGATRADAIALWNRRTTPAPASADKGGEARPHLCIAGVGMPCSTCGRIAGPSAVIDARAALASPKPDDLALAIAAHAEAVRPFAEKVAQIRNEPATGERGGDALFRAIENVIGDAPPIMRSVIGYEMVPNARMDALREARAAAKGPLLARHQPCGCVICRCQDPARCHGCGAKNCGTHPVGEIPKPVYVDDAAKGAGDGAGWVDAAKPPSDRARILVQDTKGNVIQGTWSTVLGKGGGYGVIAHRTSYRIEYDHIEHVVCWMPLPAPKGKTT